MVAATAPLPAARATDVATASTPFIVSPSYDGFFFFGSVLFVVAAYIASNLFHVDGFVILATVAVISNGPHLTSTWTRIYFDQREWRTRPLHIFLMPVLITATVVTLNLVGGIGDRILTTVLLYWATWHFLAQNWGLLRIYQRRSSEPETSWALKLERPLLYLSVAWCLLHRLQTGPRNLFGIDVAFVSLPWPVIDALGLLAAAVAAAYLALRISNARAPYARSGWLRAGFLLCAFIGFAVPFLLITGDGTPAFAAAACWHGFQYLGIIRFYHRNAWRGGIHPDARVVSYLSQPGRWRLFGYIALLLTLAGAGYVVIFLGSLVTRGTSWSIEVWGGVVWMSFTFSHYYLDGVIWKLRRDKTVAERLLVANAS
jgi:hypothetical protein